jgi:TonB family protein
MQFTLVLLPGDSIPLIAPLDSSDVMAAAVLARSLWPQTAAELWGLRVHVTGGATPAVTVSRATYCPPELTSASGSPVRMLPELRYERVTSSTSHLPRVIGPQPVPTIFEIAVSALGQVSKVTLVRSSGYRWFDSTAAQRLEQQTYASALLDGIPVPAVYRTGHGGPGAPLRLTPDDHVVVEAQVEQRPELLTTEPLRYPTALRQAGVEGRVMVRAIIDTTGRAEPSSVTVWQSPNPGFDQAARSFVLHARYRPARVHGRAVRVLVNVPIDFKIRRDEPRSMLQPSSSPP